MSFSSIENFLFVSFLNIISINSLFMNESRFFYEFINYWSNLWVSVCAYAHFCSVCKYSVFILVHVLG
jgi:hypothetical protein